MAKTRKTPAKPDACSAANRTEDRLRFLIRSDESAQARAEATMRFELTYLHEVLRRSAGNVTRAAQLAQISRGLLQRMLRAWDRSHAVPAR